LGGAFVRWYLPPIHILPSFGEILFVLGIGVLNPAHKEDDTKKVQAEEVGWQKKKKKGPLAIWIRLRLYIFCQLTEYNLHKELETPIF
jgi:hypothetical protein